MTYDPFANALRAFLYARNTLNGLPLSVTREVENACGDALFHAEAVMMKTPARTISDLRAKMEVLWCDPASMPNAETLRLVLEDAHRLTEYERSRVFDPVAWLAWFEHCGGGWIERDNEIILLVPDKSD